MAGGPPHSTPMIIRIMTCGTALQMLGVFAFPLSPATKSPRSDFMKMRLASDLHQDVEREILLLARFTSNDHASGRRLEALSSSIHARHEGRVVVQLQEHCLTARTSAGGGGGLETVTNPSVDCLPSFRFMRAGLLVDEYQTHGSTSSFEEEVHKRVEAALSLSRSQESATLKELWCSDAAGGDYREEMSVATYVVQVASTIAGALQQDLCRRGSISKVDSSPVTIADFSVQAIVLGLLSQYFPRHGFIAEETSSVLKEDPISLSAVLEVVGKALWRNLSEADLCAAIDLGTRGHGKHQGGHWGRSGRTWVLDPIDGTKGFLRGEQFCVALGLLDGGKAVAGILGCPNLPVDERHPLANSTHGKGSSRARGLLYTAARGEGSFVRPLSAGGDDTERVMVDHARRPADTRVLESAEAGHSCHEVAASVCADLGVTLPPIRVDGQCKYGLLSQGRAGIYLRLPMWGHVENIWDHAAGAVVIQEAGGKVTDTRGEALDFSLGSKLPREVVGIVATSGKIHEQVVRAVQDRQIEDWARVVALAGSGDRRGDEAHPSLPGVVWQRSSANEGVIDEWWAAAQEHRCLLAMRTSEQFYGALERGWDKLVAVLFHSSWTPESRHAVRLLESLVSQVVSSDTRGFDGATHDTELDLLQVAHSEKDTDTGDGDVDGADRMTLVLAEADVMNLIDVADRQGIGGLPSLHVHLGGREIVRYAVNREDTLETLHGKLAALAGRAEAATKSTRQPGF